MRLTRAAGAALVLAALACGKAKDQPAAKGEPPRAADAAPPPPPPKQPPPLAPVEGPVSVETGRKLFLTRCAGCHGEDGAGHGPDAAPLRRAPTDLTTTNYLCRTTDARNRPAPVPADVDVETAIDRGTHVGLPAVAGLDPAQRRSLTLYVKSIGRGFAGDPQSLYEVPPEPLDDAGSRQRGRMLYLGWGCWSCHGVQGKGDGDPAALKSVVWNGRPIGAPLPDLAAEEKYLCGGDAQSVYRVIALGEAMIMPPYGAMGELAWRPEKGPPEEWGKKLEGKIAPEELAAWRAFWAQLPAQADVKAMAPADRKARAAGLLWDLVHYVRSL